MSGSEAAATSHTHVQQSFYEAHTNKASIYHGLTWLDFVSSWQVNIWLDGYTNADGYRHLSGQHYIGTYPCEVEAAIAYDDTAALIMQQDRTKFYPLNFGPPNLPETRAKRVAAMRIAEQSYLQNIHKLQHRLVYASNTSYASNTDNIDTYAFNNANNRHSQDKTVIQQSFKRKNIEHTLSVLYTYSWIDPKRNKQIYLMSMPGFVLALKFSDQGMSWWLQGKIDGVFHECQIILSNVYHEDAKKQLQKLISMHPMISKEMINNELIVFLADKVQRQNFQIANSLAVFELQFILTVDLYIFKYNQPTVLESDITKNVVPQYQLHKNANTLSESDLLNEPLLDSLWDLDFVEPTPDYFDISDAPIVQQSQYLPTTE